jgi:hypothetical protein
MKGAIEPVCELSRLFEVMGQLTDSKWRLIEEDSPFVEVTSEQSSLLPALVERG